jgi:hypothetical protein
LISAFAVGALIGAVGIGGVLLIPALAAFGGLALILAGVALGTGAVGFARLRRQPAR